MRLPDGTDGYVAARLTEPVEDPFGSRVARRGEPILANPSETAPLVATFEAESELLLLGRYEGYLMVQAPGGRFGWLSGASEE